MKQFCQNCGHGSVAGTKFCQECGKNFTGSVNSPGMPGSLSPPGLPGSLSPPGLPPCFWVTLAGGICIVVFSLLDWISFPIFGGFNLFQYWNAAREYAGWEHNTTGIMTGVIILLVAAVILLTIALIRCKKSFGAFKILSKAGFAVAIGAPVLFMLAMGYDLASESSATFSEAVEVLMSILTAFPFLTLATAVIALVVVSILSAMAEKANVHQVGYQAQYIQAPPVPPAIRFCGACGRKIPETGINAFCPECGARVM